MVDTRAVLKTKENINILLDGYFGGIYINPTEEVIKKVRDSEREISDEKKIASQIKNQSITKDDLLIHLYANINLLNDLETANLFKAKGIGLYRTEFPFMIRNDFPIEEEQYSIYKRLFATFPESLVAIRTLDIGGDKHLPYQNQIKEANPFLGMRSIRFTLKHRSIFSTQLRAILMAGADADSKLQIMFPMISSLEELKEAKGLLDECKLELKKRRHKL